MFEDSTAGEKIVPRLASVIIDHHLPEVAEAAALAGRKAGGRRDQDTVDFIRALTPSQDAYLVILMIQGIPDVVVEKVEDDYYIIVVTAFHRT